MRVHVVPIALIVMASPVAAQNASPDDKGRVADAGKGEKKMCRRKVEIGSLVPSKPDCRTRAQWEAAAASGQADARAMVEGSRFGPTPQ